MGMYQTLADRPAVTNLLTVAVLLGASAFIAVDVRGQRPAGDAGQLYFSIDEGLTYFADGMEKLPPYDFHGMPAVRAYVYSCDHRAFVAYVERYTPGAIKELNRLDPGGKMPIDREFVVAEGTEVKRPGDAAWVKRASEAGEKILSLKCPDGGAGVPKLLLPGD